ncbi:MAG: hypothetical protein ACJ8C4_05770 [Gemmataceae bacterium]
MEDGLSSREFVAWEIYAKHFPFGDIRGDMQAGIIASTLLAMRGVNTPATDFVFKPKAAVRKESPKDLLNRFAMGWGLKVQKRE